MSDIPAFYKNEYKWMTPEQLECLEYLADLFRGMQHVYGVIRPLGSVGITINARNCSNFFATVDYNNLTRAVIIAHDRCIRFSIEPSAPNMLRLNISKRHVREGQLNERHPTIEQAISYIRNGKDSA